MAGSLNILLPHPQVLQGRFRSIAMIDRPAKARFRGAERLGLDRDVPRVVWYYTRWGTQVRVATGGIAMAEVCAPKVYLKPEVERRLQNRLKRIEGQIRGIQRLLAARHSCDDLLIQLGAVKQALNSVTVELLESHIETCVAEDVAAGRGAKALTRLKGALGHALRHVG